MGHSLPAALHRPRRISTGSVIEEASTRDRRDGHRSPSGAASRRASG